MKSAEIRSAFLNYFKRQGHEIVASSSLVPPADDKTLLFANAGMNQFKDVFLGREARSYTRATTAQRCVRAGGKHNDLENVGYTARHHTFFEMLGNFSFGDYFKREAIRFAWEFLTVELKLPKEKLWVTVYKDDKEAEDIWFNEIGIDQTRFSRLGEKDNFWSMGDTGPCGPCSEIFYDHGPDIAGDPPGGPNDDGDRYIEIWNLVFMQFNRTVDGKMEPLPKPSVDTGMGLERIAAVMQHVHSNYEIDIFQHLLKAASDLLGGVDLSAKSLRVIADHIRSCAFIIGDGVLPSNEGRGYVLRRIIRRAIRHGNKLGAKGPFFHKLLTALIDVMGDAYPELVESKQHIERILLKEEEQFSKTLDNGMRILEDVIAELKGKVIPGQTIFTLYDTYGFPVDLTNDIARERELTLDIAGYEALMQQTADANRKRKATVDYNAALNLDGQTEFTGYQQLAHQATISHILVGGEAVQHATEGQQAVLVLDQTPFYAESGGQVGDKGLLQWDGGKFEVMDTQKETDHHLHIGTIKQGKLAVGQQVELVVDQEKRQATALNHSATHLLHSALREVLGDHVLQKGSMVDSERLRFDFSHYEAVTPEEIAQIEAIVNEQIRANTPVAVEITDMDTAKQKGAMALFGEKYGEQVRLLSMGTNGFSVELCGGTHVDRTGDIGTFVVVAETGIAAGIRRIEAITGKAAFAWLKQSEQHLQTIASWMKAGRDNVVTKVQDLLDRQRQLEKQLSQLQQKLASSAGNDLMAQVKEISGVKMLAAELTGVDQKALPDTIDQLKNKLGSGVVVLSIKVADDKLAIASGVTKDLCGQIKAGDLLKFVAEQVGGKGGGRPDFARGGGSQPEKVAEALASVEGWLANKL
ncbi:alanine--tRNA ligase [Endozoicomonas sp. SM1973]|uniref:Alanine--tRNA ligase n=1 Tax=Spartinivicinus marinus TaxID=2994442 RepID=A0A853I8M8_9GAMM|nr:alanine--tRNA ligase [Spartinivicinus marinus]MCX4025387.1 alanine--tRNA ligase [Spartinivicinus marinus]NYZ69199.1 alanine--tRNA ligase [Spartinivicinus marinus]